MTTSSLRVQVATVPFRADWSSRDVPESLRPHLFEKDRAWIASSPGILVQGNRLLIVLPRCYRRGDTVPLLATRLMVAAFYRYAYADGISVGRERVSLALDQHGDPATALEGVEAALALWEDYRRRGPLTITHVATVVDRPGRIDWQRTIRSGTPIDHAGSTALRQLVKTQVQRNPLHELVSLHRQTCVNIGHEFGLGNLGLKSKWPAQEAVDLLDRHRRHCFADRHREVVGNLTKYYRSLHSRDHTAEAPIHAIFAKRFEYVWERMLQVALGHEPLKQDSFRGYYRLPGGQKTVAGLDLKPDLLVRSTWKGKPALLVLDAKDYDYDSWPASGDIGKQILYRLLLSDRIRAERGMTLSAIGNAFLFPSRDTGTQLVAEVGQHELKAKALGRLGRIVGLEVAYERVAGAYLAGRVDIDLQRLIRRLVMQRFELTP